MFTVAWITGIAGHDGSYFDRLLLAGRHHTDRSGLESWGTP